MRLRIAILTMSCLIGFGATVAGESEWLGDHAQLLFRRLYVEPADRCPEGIARIGDASIAVCGRYGQAFEVLKKSLERFDDKPNPKVVRRGGSSASTSRQIDSSKIYSFHRNWKQQANLRFRDWLEDEELVVIAFDESSGLLAVLPKDSCLEPELRAREDLYFDAPAGFQPAEILEDPSPSMPSRSPAGIRKGGDAVVQFVVTRDGELGEACVWHYRPGGFGKRALKGLDRWRFAPATLDGEPVDSVVSIAFRWRQHSCSYERSSRPIWH